MKVTLEVTIGMIGFAIQISCFSNQIFRSVIQLSSSIIQISNLKYRLNNRDDTDVFWDVIHVTMLHM